MTSEEIHERLVAFRTGLEDGHKKAKDLMSEVSRHLLNEEWQEALVAWEQVRMAIHGLSWDHQLFELHEKLDKRVKSGDSPPYLRVELSSDDESPA